MKEANKVVNLLLDDVIEIVDEEEEFIEDVEEVTLDETCVDADLKEKKYWNKCENCDYVANATKRYIALQQLRKHKDSCTNKTKQSGCSKSSKCDVCDFEDKNSMSMRRHERDEHDIITVSTSPPPKRKRRVSVENSNDAELMETSDNDEVLDLSIKLEEMEVDSSDNESKKILIELQDAKDDKIMEKEKRNDEKEKLIEDKKVEVAMRKLMTEEERIQQYKDTNKKRKQMQKSQRKKANKKIRRNESLKVKDDLPKRIPN